MRAVLGLILNILRLPLVPLWLLSRLFGRPRGAWVVLRLRPRLVEFARPRPFFLKYLPSLARVLPTPLELLRRTADHVRRDGRTVGVVFVIPPLLAGWSSCHAVRQILSSLRAAGKQVVVHLPRGGGNRELYVASAADRVFLGPEATLMTLGLSAESRYLKPLLDRFGVHVEAFARSEYKTAIEPAVRESMSEAQREQVGALLAAMDRQLVEAFAERFDGDTDRVRALFEHGFLRGEAAVEAGLVDGVAYEDELPALLGSEQQPARTVRAPAYLGYHEARFFHRILPRPYIAVVELHGVIAEEAPGTGSRGVDLERATALLRAARADKHAVGVILHIDSPGGSATASDLLHREVLRLRERKPVAALFGDVAASGGYYVAVPAQAIVAAPVTITGSIGVLSARLLARELLDRIGIRTETLRTAPHADMFSPSRELTDDERQIIDRELDAFYQAFLEVVARGRSRSVEDVDRVARGRVWSAADVQTHGLVDRLGGMEEALEEVRSRLAVPEATRRRIEPRLMTPPRGESSPPEPPKPEASVGRALAGRLAPEALAVVDLVGCGEGVLYYAADLPTIR